MTKKYRKPNIRTTTVTFYYGVLYFKNARYFYKSKENKIFILLRGHRNEEGIKYR